MTTSFFLTFSHENHLQEGNSVDLPSSVLEKYTDENKSLPFFFQIKTSYHNCYVGVCEFTADNYEVRISPLLADQLSLEENQIIQLELVEKIPVAKFLRLEPLEKKFFEFENYEELLELKLSKFSVLYPSQIIAFYENNTLFQFRVLDIQPDWETIDLEEIDDYNIQCFNIINQDIEVDIFNRFLEKELLEKRAKLEFEKNELRSQEFERTSMKHNDINILLLGQKISEQPFSPLSNDEIRQKRLERFKRLHK